MSLVDALVNFLKNKDTEDKAESPEGLCPNCWGREEYGGHFYERVKKENLDVNSKDSNIGWINDYANKHLSGIALKRKGNGREVICDKCKIGYQDADDHPES
ncbi:MAG: hypothetical protein HKO66_09825 [Saprospiraceae bacterium]|nr:hypothetical protein [Bacteroidia bacterium]NNE14615.1 hypothetical protein [Saprospiraceae bacterium]NNL92518.1 hypothetical protein [Saprospiraceae bacterium]